MNQTNDSIKVGLSTPERKYAKAYHDFLDNSFLTTEEQMIFIVLKSYVDFKEDSGESYPSMETICKRAKMSEKRARKNINSLIEKGIVKKIRRGHTKSNLYILSDTPEIWACDSIEEVVAVANSVGDKNEKILTTEDYIAELERRGYEVIIKKKEAKQEAGEGVGQEEMTKKEPVSDGGQTIDTSTSAVNLHNDTTDEPESQESSSTSETDADALLDRLWVLYPVKKGKGQISAAQRKKLLKIGYDEMARAIERYKQYVESVDYLHYQNGSTFFNGGYLDYLDANYDPESEREARNNQAKSGQTKSSQTKNKFNDYPHRDYDFDAIKRGMFDQ